MRTAVYYPPNEIKIEDRPLPKIRDEEILLKMLACGICGTDVLKVQRALPKNPVILGHELIGEVVQCGSKVEKFKIGDRIAVAHHVPCGLCHYCRHGNHSMCNHFKRTNLDPGGFADFIRISAEHLEHTAFLIPKHVTDEAGIFVEPLACCVRNIRRARLLAGDFAVVVGAGSIGLMMIQLLKLIKVEVLTLDLKPERLELAKQLGSDHVEFGDSKNIRQLILEKTDARGADLVIFTAGGARVFEQAFSWIRDGGALNLFASLSKDLVPTSLDALYHHEINIFSSYSPSPEDLVEAHRLICEDLVKVLPLVTHQLKLSDLQKGIQLLTEQKAIKVVLRP